MYSPVSGFNPPSYGDSSACKPKSSIVWRVRFAFLLLESLFIAFHYYSMVCFNGICYTVQYQKQFSITHICSYIDFTCMGIFYVYSDLAFHSDASFFWLACLNKECIVTLA